MPTLEFLVTLFYGTSAASGASFLFVHTGKKDRKMTGLTGQFSKDGDTAPGSAGWKRHCLKSLSRLQFITHFTGSLSFYDSAMIALKGGCRWIQLRMKDADSTELERVARLVLPECRKAGAVFIVDDNLEVALRTGADGVHLGKNDMPVTEARKIAGGNFIIGGTANTFEDISRLAGQGADYIGCGPFRFTTTKKNLATILGLEGYSRIVARMRENGIELPVVAIGGITFDDIPDIMATGVNGIALSGSILRAADPVGEMERIARELQQYNS